MRVHHRSMQTQRQTVACVATACASRIDPFHRPESMVCSLSSSSSSSSSLYPTLSLASRPSTSEGHPTMPLVFFQQKFHRWSTLLSCSLGWQHLQHWVTLSNDLLLFSFLVVRRVFAQILDKSTCAQCTRLQIWQSLSAYKEDKILCDSLFGKWCAFHTRTIFGVQYYPGLCSSSLRAVYNLIFWTIILPKLKKSSGHKISGLPFWTWWVAHLIKLSSPLLLFKTTHIVFHLSHFLSYSFLSYSFGFSFLSFLPPMPFFVNSFFDLWPVHRPRTTTMTTFSRLFSLETVV